MSLKKCANSELNLPSSLIGELFDKLIKNKADNAIVTSSQKVRKSPKLYKLMKSFSLLKSYMPKAATETVTAFVVPKMQLKSKAQIHSSQRWA